MENEQNMLLGLLQLVSANGDTVESRIVIQKEAYLLARSGYMHISANSFSYHYYGPFSRELSDCLQFAVSSELLKEHPTPGMNDGIKYSYVLTDLGKQFLNDAGNMDEKFVKLVGACSKEKWRTLELAATTLFLQSREKTDGNTAFELALKLKPDCKPYSGATKVFLESWAS